MFSKKSFTGLKKAASVFLAVCMLAGLFTCLTVISVVADGAVATEDAVFIGKTGSEKQAAVFMPVDLPHPTENMSLFLGEETFKVSFKCKMLSGSKPIVGVYGIDPAGSNKAFAHADWCDQESVVVEDGICTATIKVNFPYTYKRDSQTGLAIIDEITGEPVLDMAGRVNPNGEGYRSFYLLIGNSYWTGSETAYGDFDDSFIVSDVKLTWYDSDEEEYEIDDETGEEVNRLPAFTSSNINFNGTYFIKNDGCDNWDSPLGAHAMQWHVMAAPDYVKQITVPADYNTSDNYAAANFQRVDETDYTREYYTNPAYEGKYFVALKNSADAGFELISSDVNKKMVVIDANHEGEADINTATGKEAAPLYNRAANIFLPISYGQYAMKGSTAENINFLVKVTFKAVRLEGDSTPVIGRIVGKKGNSSGRGSQALCKAAYNIPVGDYASNAETYNETYKDAEGNRLKCEYDAETGEFTGWMRVRCADNDYSSRWGCNEVITIGNAEHVWAAGGKFDSTSFNSSFAISNIKVDLYECGSGYVRGEMIAEDIAPHLYADTLDTTSRWAYQFRDDDGRDCSNSDYDCIRAPQKLWSAEGNVGMVHTENLTPCMAAGHTVTHNAATDTTREYWTCSCGKNFAEPYCKTEITDLTAKKQIIYVAASEKPATAFIPLKLCGYEGNRWFKFTCKCKLIGGESVPVVSTLYNIYNGSNQCETTVTTSNDGDMAVYEYSYDPETFTLTAYIKAWIKDIINQKDRYPFERINAVSGANIALLIGNGRYIGGGYTDQSTDTDFAISEPELYMLDCTAGGSGLETAKTSETLGDNIIAPITDKTVDLDAEYVATWTNANNPLAAAQGKWYITGADKQNITAKNLPENYFSKDYVECTHQNTAVAEAVVSTCHTNGHSEYTYCIDCGEVLEGSDAPLPLDPTNHEGETEVRGAALPSCTAAGYTGDTYCLGCNAKLAEGETVPIFDHTVGDWLSDETNHWHYCSVCENNVDIAAHTYEWEVTKQATAEENGLKEEVCSVCGHKSGASEEIVYSAHMPGDINNDGSVNNKDLTRLFQYLSDWDVEVNAEALDVNGDGSVNNKDLTRLFQYLSDWDVTIF